MNGNPEIQPSKDLAEVAAGRWELLRALGAALVSPPPDNTTILSALGLPEMTRVQYTDAFVLSAPPHAAIHHSAEGTLGGEALDRISGFWRVLGLVPPPDADHLGTLLMFYAELGAAESAAGNQRVRRQLQRARIALLQEHLTSWAPAYLWTLRLLPMTAVAAWAELTAAALARETSDIPTAGLLPLALRSAPPPLSPQDSVQKVLDAVVSPLQSGLILTRQELSRAAAELGLGFRQGERRFALKSMLEQDKPGTLTWLAGHAEHWRQLHAGVLPGSDLPVAQWWSARAAATASALQQISRLGPPAQSSWDEFEDTGGAARAGNRAV